MEERISPLSRPMDIQRWARGGSGVTTIKFSEKFASPDAKPISQIRHLGMPSTRIHSLNVSGLSRYELRWFLDIIPICSHWI